MSTMKLLRRTGWVEGISLLVLLFIAMPLKYFWHKPDMVKIVGWIHGFLFITFMMLLFIAYREKKWPFKTLFLGGLAAFLPFGTFFFDRKLKQEEEE